MKNSISDLSDLLFQQIEILDEEMSQEKLEQELRKADVKVRLSKEILKIADIQVRCVELKEEYGLETKDMPTLLERPKSKLIQRTTGYDKKRD